MRPATRFAIVLAVATTVSTSSVHAGAVDDGPCPPGTFGHIPKGADYHDDTWHTANGVAFGFADTEDECWTPVTNTADMP